MPKQLGSKTETLTLLTNQEIDLTVLEADLDQNYTQQEREKFRALLMDAIDN
ncbi:MAG: hypothetical protein RBS56_03855 [Candidatus Gracilibacteria bacterium]|nr:hypothetical protein [Candidatus Gracilibacteria bacterium]